MNKIVIAMGLIAALSTATCASAAEIRLGGGGPLLATVFMPLKSAFEKTTGHNLIILQSNKGSLKQLWSGKLDAAVITPYLDDMISEAAKDGIKIDKDYLQMFEVGTNKTVVMVHPSNTISSMTKGQLKDLFTGKITNWKDIGGRDEPVLVVWGKNTFSQNKLFENTILDGENVTPEHLDTSDYKDIKDNVASNSGAIGIDPLGLLDHSVKGIMPSPEVKSSILLLTKGAPSLPVRQLIDFIKNKKPR